MLVDLHIVCYRAILSRQLKIARLVTTASKLADSNTTKGPTPTSASFNIKLRQGLQFFMWFLLKASFCVASLTLNAKKSNGSRGIQTSDYPDPYKTVTARQEFVDLYDLSEVPRIERATPHNAEQPVDCTKLNSDTCSWGCGGCIRSSEIRSCPNQKHWGLSFADGPSSVTKQLLDDLKAAKVNATFFVTGGQSIQFQTQLRDTHAAGHQICILNWSHRALTSMSTEVVVAHLPCGWSMRLQEFDQIALDLPLATLMIAFGQFSWQ